MNIRSTIVKISALNIIENIRIAHNLGKLSTAKTYELISSDEKSVVNKHCSDILTKFAVGITESQEKLPTFFSYQNFINDRVLQSSFHRKL